MIQITRTKVVRVSKTDSKKKIIIMVHKIRYFSTCIILHVYSIEYNKFHCTLYTYKFVL